MKRKIIIFKTRTYFLINYKNKMSTKEIFSQFSPVLWTRIPIGSVFRSFLDPDQDPHIQI